MSAGQLPGHGRPVRPPVRPVDIEIDLHGMTVSQATKATERHLRQAHEARLHIVKVIHGHGTGALRSAVNQLLKSSPLVKEHYPASHGDGGYGVTIAELDYGQRESYNSRENYSITPTAERWK